MHSFSENVKMILSECKEQSGIIGAYLFGSQVTGEKSNKSDIDIALLLDEENKKSFPYLDFKVKLERKLNNNVDLIILNNAGEVLKYQVRRFGKLIYETDSLVRKKWELSSRKFYQDFLYLHQIYMNKLRKHFGVSNGQSRNH